MSHNLNIRVYYEDTDAGGIVYHASYLRFAERARTELLRDSGFQNSDLLTSEGIIFVVRHMEIDYLKPARLDDLLEISTSIDWMRNSSLFMNQQITHDNEYICKLGVTLVTVDRSGRPVRIPEKVYKMFEKHLK